MALEVTTKKGRRALSYNGFVYRNISKKESSGLYRWRCTVKTCRGRIVTSSDCLDIKIIGEHNHAPPRRLRLSQFPSEFISPPVKTTVKSDLTSTSPPAIDDAEDNLLSFKAEPLLPTEEDSSSDSGTLLIPPLYHYTPDGRQFLLYSAEDASFALFGTLEGLATLFSSHQVRIDVSGHLVVFHRIYYRRFIPLVYCLLARTSQFHYEAVVSALQQLGQSQHLDLEWSMVTWTPHQDFLTGLQSLLTAGTGHIQCSGCPGYFFSQLKNKMIEFGLEEDYRVCPHLSVCLRMCSALVLLPEREINRAWLDLCQWMLCDTPPSLLHQAQSLANYIKTEWIDNSSMPLQFWNGARTGLSQLPALRMWTYRLDTQLSCSTESKSNATSTAAPVVTDLCNFFTSEQTQSDIELSNFRAGQLSHDVDQLFELRNSTALRQIREEFDNSEIDRLTFLRNLADLLQDFV